MTHSSFPHQILIFVSGFVLGDAWSVKKRHRTLQWPDRQLERLRHRSLDDQEQQLSPGNRVVLVDHLSVKSGHSNGGSRLYGHVHLKQDAAVGEIFQVARG